MAEVWDQASSLATAQPQVTQDVQEIRTSCTQDHSKGALFECPECYGRAVDRIRRRYLESVSPEWFSGRRAFLNDLEAVLSEAKARELDPKSLDALIQDEKRRWYLENVRSSVISVVAEDSLGQETLAEMLGSKHFLLEELASEIRHAIEQDDVAREARAALLDKLGTAADPQERLSLLSRGLFGVAPGGEVAENEKKYYDMLAMGVPARTVVEQIVEDRHANQGARDQENKHRQRISDLQRARTAHERKKSRKTEDLESLAKEQCPERLYNPAPCLTCGKMPDPKDMLACGLCQVFDDFGIEDTSRPGVWCSPKCYSVTHEEHIEGSRSHSCAAGDACVRTTEMDTSMSGVDADVFELCNECLHSLKKPSVYCSSRCAEADFQSHRERDHNAPKPSRDNAEDRETFIFSDEDPSKYHARTIADYITPLDDALRALQRRTGITMGNPD